MTINVLIPVLNENLRLEKGVNTAVLFMRENLSIPFKITIVDNGSTDETPEISKRLVEKYDEVEYIQLKEKGVGLAFREGVRMNTCDVVGYMDCDLSTDLSHLIQIVEIFEKTKDVSIVNGSRFSKGSKVSGRKWYRNVTSYGLTFLLKKLLKMQANDSICGFKFFKKEDAESLIAMSSSEPGWFFIIELLIRAEHTGLKVVELPVIWKDDPNTKVKYKKVITNYLKNIIRLRKDLYS